jgi:hypothetical protein
MAVTCTKTSLTSAAACWVGLSERQLRAVTILSLCNQLNGITMNCSIPALVTAATCAGYYDMSVRQQLAVIAYLQCQVASTGGGGTGTGATFGNYGGTTPNFTPSSGNGLAIDTSNDTLWEYHDGQWHMLV